MNPQQFANLIRQKYPGVYDSVPDSELTQRVVAKYPEYASQVKIVTPEKDTALPHKIGEFSEGVAKSTFGKLAQFGQNIAESTIGKLIPKRNDAIDNTRLTKELNVPSTTTAGKAGEIAGEFASFAVPGGAVTKATKGATLLGKIIPRAITSGTAATVQQGEIGKDALIAAGVETVLPVAGKALSPIKNVVGRLTKSLASGLSGASAKTIDAMIAEPKVAKTIAQNIDADGQSDVLTKNAQTIINGVSKVRQEARKAFGAGIESLKETDIQPKMFRDNVSSTLDKYGSVMKGGQRKLTNIEFTDPKNIKTASELISRLQNTKLDGASLRKLTDDIESKAYKIATSDERLSFNSFIKDLSSSVKSSITKSTDKLGAINKAYSTDMQLTEAVEGILGKVKFKNLDEVRKVSEKLEGLFSKKGISPEIIDDFLTRVGVKPSEFRASEAVRQISDMSSTKNTVGESMSEIIRGVTSAVITPKAVRDLAIKTGLTENTLAPILEKLAPQARAAFIQLIINADDDKNNPSPN